MLRVAICAAYLAPATTWAVDHILTTEGDLFTWTNGSVLGTDGGIYTNGDNVIVDASATASISGDVTAGSLVVNADDTLVLNAANEGANSLVADALSVNGTLRLEDNVLGRYNNTGGVAGVQKLLGDGTFIFDVGAGNTYLNLVGEGGAAFTGTIQLEENSSGLRLDSNYTGTTQQRYALEYTGESAVTVYVRGTVNVAGSAQNGIFLNSLSGNIDLVEQGSLQGYARTHINLEMTQDNTWTGTWAIVNTSSGWFEVDSADGQYRTLTITRGQTQAVNHNSHRLDIHNAEVKMTESSQWNGAIQFFHADSKLTLEGSNNLLIGSDNDVGGLASTGGASIGTINVNNGAAGGTVTVQGTNSGYKGVIHLQSGKLVLQSANSFSAGQDISIVSGTLDMSGVAQTNNVEMADGAIIGASAWTGDLHVTENIGASLSGMQGGSITVDSGAVLDLGGIITLSDANTIINSGTLNFSDDLVFNLNFLNDSAWSRTGNTYTLQMIDNSPGGDITGFDSLTSSNLDFTLGAGKTIFFHSDGSISYDVEPLYYNTPGQSFSWSDGGDFDGNTFSNGGDVVFNSSATAQIVGDVQASSVEIASGTTLTLASDGMAGSVLNKRRNAESHARL